MVNWFRRLLINFGKVLPFILCFVLLVSYIECCVSLYIEDFMIYKDSITLNTPISFWLADKFEYDYLTLFAMTILSYAVETCLWNKIGILYLALQLAFKNYIADFELEPTTIYIICLANILVTGYLTIKGIMLYKSF